MKGRMNATNAIDTSRYRRIEACRLLGSQLADLLDLSLDGSGGDPDLWPARTAANSIRIYAGLLPPELAGEVEREIRRGLRVRWSILRGHPEPDPSRDDPREEP
jgi:hypothetical protein